MKENWYEGDEDDAPVDELEAVEDDVDLGDGGSTSSRHTVTIAQS